MPTSINGINSEQYIVNMWKQYFHDLVNCVNNSSAKNLAFDVSYNSSIKMLPEEVKYAIRNFDCNKSCGLDGTDVDHLKYCSEHILSLLSMCFTVCLYMAC